MPSDVPAVLSFIRGLAEYEKLTHLMHATEEQLRETLFGERRYAEVLIARVGGKPVGFALFFHNYSTFLAKPGLYLEDLFVLPEYRGKGVGRSLLKAVAKVAQDRKCGRFEWTVLDWNEPAIRFYEKIGATLLPDWRVCRMTESEIQQLVNSE